MVLLTFGAILYTRVGGDARVYAATSSNLNFQARLLNANGGLVPDGTYNIEFKLYDSLSAGASAQGVCSLDSSTDDCRWVETRTGANKVTIKNGYFSVNLASVTAFPAINWDQDLWLTMNIGGTGAPGWDGEMSPRVKLTAVPHAFNSSQLDGIDSTGFAQLAPSAVQAVNTALAALRLNQTGAGLLAQLQGDGSDVFTISKTGTVASSGSATFSGGTLNLGSAAQAGGLVLFDGSSNTGTLQTAALGSNRVYTLPDADGTVCLTTTCPGAANSFVKDGNSFGSLATLGTNDNFDLAFETNGTTKMTILANGNVGIGTSGTPAALLSVGGTTGNLTVDSSGNLATSGTLNTNTFTGTGLTFGGAGATTIQAALNQGLTLQSQGSGALTLASGSGTVILGSNTLQNVSSGFTLDVNNAGLSTFNIVNNNGSNLANLDVEGGISAGNSNAFSVNSDGDLTAVFTALNGTSTANGAALVASTSLTLTSAANFDVGNYVQVNSTNCGGTGVNVCYAKVTAKATDTLTITPALTWANGSTVNEYHVPELGGTNTSDTLTSRYGRGYFIAGIATGNGTTFYNENSIETSLSSFNLLNTGVTTLNIGGAATTITLGSASTNVNLPGSLSLGGMQRLDGTGALTNIASLTGSGALTISSAASGDLTLTSSSGLININAGTMRRTAAGLTTIDLVDTGNTTLAFTNSGAGALNLTVDGSGSFGAGLTVTSGGLSVTGNSTITGSLSGLTGLTVASGGASITGGLSLLSGDLNVIAGVIQTNSVTRINNSGDLVNIGAVTASGLVTGGSFGLASQTITAWNGIPLATITGSTFSTLQHAVNLYMSPGRLTGGNITDAGSGNVTVATGTGLIRAIDDDISELRFFDWPAATISIPDNSKRFIGVTYNAGTPIVIAKVSDTWNYDTEFPLGVIIRRSGTTYIENNPMWVGDNTTNVIERFYGTRPHERDERVGGLILGSTGTRNITLTAGKLWDRLNEFDITSIDTSAGGTFNRYYRDGTGGFNRDDNLTQWNNILYDNGSGTLATMTDGYYSNKWFYVTTDNKLIAMIGQAEYGSLALAQDENPPGQIPDRLVSFGKLVGRIIFQKNGATATRLESAFTSTFTGSVVTTHSALAGLLADDHTQYALLAGRAGGQVLFGGINASDNLVLNSTSHLTKGNIILNGSGGLVGIGTSGTPSALLSVGGTTGNLTIDASGNLATAGTVRLSSAGALQNITGFAQASGNFSIAGTGTFSTGTGAVGLNGATTVDTTTNSAVGLTVNSTTGTAATAVVFNQSGAANGLNVNLTNTVGTIGAGLQINRNGTGGTTTNGLQILNTAGTLTNGIAIGSGTQAIDTGINLASTGITNDIRLQNGETINNDTNGEIIFQTDATTTIFRISAGVLQMDIGAAIGANGQRLCHSGADGNAGLVSIGDCNTLSADLAEYYGSDGTPEAGDIVATTGQATEVVIRDTKTSKAWVKRAEAGDRFKIIGIISTSPSGEVMSEGVFTDSEHPVPVALAGRVPVKVNLENGPIAAGDKLTLSSRPGMAMKATGSGAVIGTALEVFDGSDPAKSKIIAFVNLGWWGDTGNQHLNSTQSGLESTQPTNDGPSDIDASSIATNGTLRLTGDGQLQNITGLQLVSGGASIAGGLNNNGGGINNAGFVAGATTIDAQSIRLAAIGTDNLLTLTKDGQGVFTIFNNGALQLKLDSANAFNIKNAGGMDIFNIDSLNGRVSIGNGDAAKTILFTLDNRALPDDPPGTNGSSYYNTVFQRFRCYENNAWRDCLPAGDLTEPIAFDKTEWLQPDSDQEFPGMPRLTSDLRMAHEYRLRMRVTSGSASAASCRLQYAFSDNGPWKNLSANSPDELSLAEAGTLRTDWLKIADEARKEDSIIRVMCKGGDGRSVVFYGVSMQLR